jgi:hypothetical protein
VQELFRGGSIVADEMAYPSEPDPRKAHVDGDALAPVVELGAQWLREAVAMAEEGHPAATFGGERFAVLAREVLQLPNESVDVYEAVMKWVDELVNDAVL